MATRITPRQLEYSIAASECGSIAEAAQRIHVSPSAISSAITQLESELGTQIFVRHHAHGLSVTPAGRELLREFRLILAQMEGLYSVSADAQGSIRGPLRVGCFSTLAALVAPEICRGFARAHPGVQVTQIEDHQEGLLERLRLAEIDVAITYDLQLAGTDIDFEALASLPPHAIVSEFDPLADQSMVTIEELAKLPMVLLDMPLSRAYFLSLFHNAGVSPVIAAQSASFDVVRSLVANGVGYSLFNIRPRWPHAVDGKKIVTVKLAGQHRPMQLGIAWVRDLKLRHVVEAFMQRCRTFISNEYIPGMIAPAYSIYSRPPPDEPEGPQSPPT
jgi:DNA-binding transcriptional LysR family regulator